MPVELFQSPQGANSPKSVPGIARWMFGGHGAADHDGSCSTFSGLVITVFIVSGLTEATQYLDVYECVCGVWGCGWVWVDG